MFLQSIAINLSTRIRKLLFNSVLCSFGAKTDNKSPRVSYSQNLTNWKFVQNGRFSLKTQCFVKTAFWQCFEQFWSNNCKKLITSRLSFGL